MEVKITDKEYFDLDEWYCDWYFCPNCDNRHIAKGFKYCPDCGAKLIWEVTDED